MPTYHTLTTALHTARRSFHAALKQHFPHTDRIGTLHPTLLSALEDWLSTWQDYETFTAEHPDHTSTVESLYPPEEYHPIHLACHHGYKWLVDELQSRNKEAAHSTTSYEQRTPLHCLAASTVLAEEGSNTIADTLLAAGADPMARDRNGLLPFHLAIQADNQALAKRLATGKSPWDSTMGITGSTALHQAVRYNAKEAMAWLLDTVPSYDQLQEQDTDGLTAFHHMARRGLEGAFKLCYHKLKQHKERLFPDKALDDDEVLDRLVHTVDKKGNTLLHTTLESGRVDLLPHLLPDSRLGKTAVVRYLNCHNSRGYTPLHAAAALGRNETVQSFLSLIRERYGDSIVWELLRCKTRDNNGLTALEITKAKKRVKTNRVLLETSTDIEPSIKGRELGVEEGSTVLDFTANHRTRSSWLREEKEHPHAIRYNVTYRLLKGGYSHSIESYIRNLSKERLYRDLRWQDPKRGQTIVHQLAYRGLTVVLNNLFNALPPEMAHECLMAQDKEGNTPLHIAIREGRPTVLETLLAADVKYANFLHDTKHLAFSAGVRNNEGYLPIHVGVAMGREKTVAAYCKALRKVFSNHTPIIFGEDSWPATRSSKSAGWDADQYISMFGVNGAASYGRTPLIIAANHLRAKIAHVLLEAGADPEQETDLGSNALIRFLTVGRSMDLFEELGIATLPQQKEYQSIVRSLARTTDLHRFTETNYERVHPILRHEIEEGLRAGLHNYLSDPTITTAWWHTPNPNRVAVFNHVLEEGVAAFRDEIRTTYDNRTQRSEETYKLLARQGATTPRLERRASYDAALDANLAQQQQTDTTLVIPGTTPPTSHSLEKAKTALKFSVPIGVVGSLITDTIAKLSQRGLDYNMLYQLFGQYRHMTIGEFISSANITISTELSEALGAARNMTLGRVMQLADHAPGSTAARALMFGVALAARGYNIVSVRGMEKENKKLEKKLQKDDESQQEIDLETYQRPIYTTNTVTQVMTMFMEAAAVAIDVAENNDHKVPSWVSWLGVGLQIASVLLAVLLHHKATQQATKDRIELSNLLEQSEQNTEQGRTQ